MQRVIDKLSAEIEKLSRQAEEKEKDHAEQVQMKTDELIMQKKKAVSMEGKYKSMEKDFKMQYNSVREELVSSEENAKLLCINLTDQRDRNQVLKNEVKVLKQKVDGEKENGEIEILKKELREFKNTVNQKLMCLENVQKHQNHQPQATHRSSRRKTNNSSNIADAHSNQQSTTPKTLARQPSRSSEKSRRSSLSSQSSSQSSTTSSLSSASPKRNTARESKKPGNTLRFTSNNPQTSELNPDENGRSNVTSGTDTVLEDKLRRISKLKENRERRNRKTMIFGSSHAKSIKRDEFNEELEMGTVDIIAYPGHTAQYITKYMLPHLVEECPHT